MLRTFDGRTAEVGRDCHIDGELMVKGDFGGDVV